MTITNVFSARHATGYRPPHFTTMKQSVPWVNKFINDLGLQTQLTDTWFLILIDMHRSCYNDNSFLFLFMRLLCIASQQQPDRPAWRVSRSVKVTKPFDVVGMVSY